MLLKKLDFQIKNVKDEFLEISNRIKTFFCNKMEKIMKRVNNFAVRMKTEDFKKMQAFLTSLVSSLKIHFKVNTVNMSAVLEE